MFPLLYWGYNFRVNYAIGKGTLRVVWNNNRKGTYAGFYGVGCIQAVSCIFMLWAVFKLYMAIGRNFNLRELFSQKMIIVHIVTFLVYLLSLSMTYIYNS